MKGLRALIGITAAVISKEGLAEKLGEALENYRLNPCDSTWKSLSAICLIVLTKSIVNDNVSKAMEIEDYMAKIDQIRGTLDGMN